MKIIIPTLILLISLNIYANNIRVMTFNTTCSICEKGNYDKFKKRKYWILDTIKRANPDLISLQEVLTTKQLRWFKKKLKNKYIVQYYRKYFIFKYADPALFIKKERFKVYSKGGFWLGPRSGRFSLGWKIAFPRQVRWTRLIDLENQKELMFVGSHFDNKGKNKEKSVNLLIKKMEKLNIPIIFAADTNLKPNTEGYIKLKSIFKDTFDYKESITLIGENTTLNNSCNLEKAKEFPNCRVDHIFLSKKEKWHVGSWFVDQVRYDNSRNFTSDHRAFYVDVQLK
jgi:endonuclease/exonuclease/phosphatase family metal-dependent hydrolase